MLVFHDPFTKSPFNLLLPVRTSIVPSSCWWWHQRREVASITIRIWLMSHHDPHVTVVDSTTTMS